MTSLIPLSFNQLNDVTVALQVLGADQVTQQNCIGLTPAMYIKESKYSGDGAPSTIVLTTSSGLAWVNQAAGSLTAQVPHGDLQKAGYQWWRLDLSDESGDRTTVMDGPLTVLAV